MAEAADDGIVSTGSSGTMDAPRRRWRPAGPARPADVGAPRCGSSRLLERAAAAEHGVEQLALAVARNAATPTSSAGLDQEG